MYARFLSQRLETGDRLGTYGADKVMLRRILAKYDGCGTYQSSSGPSALKVSVRILLSLLVLEKPVLVIAEWRSRYHRTR